MYLFAPQRGRGRRAQLADQTSAFLRQTGTTFSRLGRDVANRAYGVAAETHGTVQDRLGYGEEASAEKLLQRVRAALGRATAHAAAVQVMTDNHGRVTLTGKVLSGESDAAVAAVRGVRGVSEVVNLLEVDNEMTGQGSGRSSAAAGYADAPAPTGQGSGSVPPM
jgi:osmotically-inducible protein OsmY